jgi:hypothetical protein
MNLPAEVDELIVSLKCQIAVLPNPRRRSNLRTPLSVLGRTKQDLSKDTELDKKIFSEKSRYFIGRYYAGFQFVIAGLGAIALGLIILFSH